MSQKYHDIVKAVVGATVKRYKRHGLAKLAIDT